MGCLITSNISINCDSLKRVGGLNSTVWIFNISDLNTPIDGNLDGYVTNIPLLTYRTLYKIEGPKYSHSFEVNEIRDDDDGTVQWEHKLMLKIVNTTPEDDALLEDLSVSEVGAIVLTGNREFIILGGQNAYAANLGCGFNLTLETNASYINHGWNVNDRAIIADAFN
jgi:hypothetical protein